MATDNTFVITLNSDFMGDKTYAEIVDAFNEGRRIIGEGTDEDGGLLTYVFSFIGVTSDRVEFHGYYADTRKYRIICSVNNTWRSDIIQSLSKDEAEELIQQTIDDAVLASWAEVTSP